MTATAAAVRYVLTINAKRQTYAQMSIVPADRRVMRVPGSANVRRDRFYQTDNVSKPIAATAALSVREARRSAPRTGNASNVRQTANAPAAGNVRAMCANVRVRNLI